MTTHNACTHCHIAPEEAKPPSWKLVRCVCVCVCVHTQSCPTLRSPMDCSPPGSSVRGISQARILAWVARGIFLLQGDLPNPGIKLGLLCLLPCHADSLPLAPPGRKPRHESYVSIYFWYGLCSLVEVQKYLYSFWDLIFFLTNF